MEALVGIISNSIAYLWELVTNQKNKKLQEVQLQRDQNKAFIAYEKISKTIESVIHEEQLKICIDMINNCCHVLNIALFIGVRNLLKQNEEFEDTVLETITDVKVKVSTGIIY